MVFILYLLLAALSLHCFARTFSMCGEWGLLFVAVCGLLIKLLLLFRSTGSRVLRLQELQHVGSIDVAHRLSCSVAGGIFSDQESNPCLLHWQAGSLPLRQEGRSLYVCAM